MWSKTKRWVRFTYTPIQHIMQATRNNSVFFAKAWFFSRQALQDVYVVFAKSQATDVLREGYAISS